MDRTLILWTFLALAGFWGVGAYNRLMRMRARGFDALGSVEKHMKQYAGLVETHLSLPGTGSAHGTAARIAEDLPEMWAVLLYALNELDAGFKAARATPLAVPSMTRIHFAADAVQQAWRILCEHPVDLAGPVVPELMRLQWDAITVKVDSARGGCNQILEKYNEALDQFPARLVGRLMSFKPAGRL
jgi:LemA protein